MPGLRKIDANRIHNFKTMLKGAYAPADMSSFIGELTGDQMDQSLNYLAQRNADLRSTGWQQTSPASERLPAAASAHP